MTRPVFSIVTVTLNEGECLRGAIESVCGQEGAGAIEHIIVDGSPGANAISGRVMQVTFIGNLTEIDVDTGGLSLHVQMSPARDWTLGQSVTLGVDPEHIVLLPRSDHA